jgi:hypothetical protein
VALAAVLLTAMAQNGDGSCKYQTLYRYLGKELVNIDGLTLFILQSRNLQAYETG